MQSLKQEVMESKCDRLCWWLHVPWHRDSTMGHVQWSGGEISDGEQSWTTPSIRIQRKLYVRRVSGVLVLIPHIFCVIHGLKL